MTKQQQQQQQQINRHNNNDSAFLVVATGQAATETEVDTFFRAQGVLGLAYACAFCGLHMGVAAPGTQEEANRAEYAARTEDLPCHSCGISKVQFRAAYQTWNDDETRICQRVRQRIL